MKIFAAVLLFFALVFLVGFGACVALFSGSNGFQNAVTIILIGIGIFIAGVVAIFSAKKPPQKPPTDEHSKL